MLQPIARVFVFGFGFNNGNLEITCIAKQVIGALVAFSFRLIAYNKYAAICKALLSCERMGLIVPTCLDESGLHIFSAGIRFI
ncbi:MAG: hypothetical protein M0Q43_05825 [Methanothrix sp.]|nr:hypothetical protein [Methanothrix sp.]